jgi:hypothetical protein
LINKTKYTENLKSYIKEIIDSKELKVTNSSRHCYHIRFELKGNLNDFISFFDEFNIKVSISDYSCSSKSPTYILENVKAVKNIPIHTKLYWVNNAVTNSKTGSKIFATKDLSPDKLNVTNENYNIENLIIKTSDELKKKYNICISEQLISLLNSAKNKNDIIELKEKLDFSRDDLVVISKDFGEILSAIWLMSNFNFSQIFFPKNSNEKLVDFYAKKVYIDYPVSVKSGNGSKVYLKNIIDSIKKRNKLNRKNFKNEVSLEIIKIVEKNTMKSQMIMLHQYLKTEMIEDLSKIMKMNIKDIREDSVIEWVKNKSIEELKIILKDWWEKYSKLRKFDVADKERLVIASLGEKIKFILNENEQLKKSLNFLAKQISLLQINVDVKEDRIIFKKRFFKESEFKFDWQGYSSGNKLGFNIVY